LTSTSAICVHGDRLHALHGVCRELFQRPQFGWCAFLASVDTGQHQQLFYQHGQAFHFVQAGAQRRRRSRYRAAGAR
jgi:hypothetical protein